MMSNVIKYVVTFLGLVRRAETSRAKTSNAETSRAETSRPKNEKREG